jgi:hypothetical protein
MNNADNSSDKRSGCYSYAQTTYQFSSVAQSSEPAPFTSDIVGSNPVGDDLSDIHVKRVSQRSAESCGFPPGTPVSSHRVC